MSNPTESLGIIPQSPSEIKPQDTKGTLSNHNSDTKRQDFIAVIENCGLAIDPQLVDTIMAEYPEAVIRIDLLPEYEKRVNGNGRKSSAASNGKISLAGKGDQRPAFATPAPIFPSAYNPCDQVDLDTVTKSLDRNDQGNAELFYTAYQGRVKYDQSSKTFYLWNGVCWQKDLTKYTESLIPTELAAQYFTAAAQAAKANRDSAKLAKRAGILTTAKGVRDTLELVKRIPGISIEGSEWDKQDRKLCVKNGVIDLETGDLLPGNPDWMMIHQSNTEYRGLDEPCPTFEQFLLDVLGDPETVNYMQRLLGHGLSGLHTEAVFPVFWGNGRNGKDTLLDTIKYVLGGIAGEINKECLLDMKEGGMAGGATSHLYSLLGMRIAWASEPSNTVRLNGARIKEITGCSGLRCRALYSNEVTIDLKALVILVTNPKPRADPNDSALWDRVRLIEFPYKFVDNPTPGTKEKQRDTELREKLKTEASGILAWLVRGFIEYRKHGLGMPETVNKITSEYRLEQDDVKRFLEECTVKDNLGTIQSSVLYKAYVDWCTDNTDRQPYKQAGFSKQVKAAGYTGKHTKQGNVFDGICLIGEG